MYTFYTQLGSRILLTTVGWYLPKTHTHRLFYKVMIPRSSYLKVRPYAIESTIVWDERDN